MSIRESIVAVLREHHEVKHIGHLADKLETALSAAEPQPAPSVAVKALEGAFKHFKVVYDPPNGISINEATRAEAIKLAASALYATLSQAEIETLRACEDWKATFEIMRIRRVDKAAEAWRCSQKIVDNLLDRGLLEFGEPNTTYRITDAGRSALSAQVQDVAGSGGMEFPEALTDDLRDVLSTMIWTSGQIAACLRAGGDQIKTRAEDEQAHVLHWLISLALKHGPEWRAKASERIKAIRDAAAPAKQEG